MRGQRAAAPRMPTSSTIKRVSGGTHRTVEPSETVARVRRIAGPMGITRVANVTGLDCIGIPVFMVCRPNARSLAVSQGKGLDADAARASGLMEAAELFHAERIAKPLKHGSWNDLRFNHDLVDVEAMPRISLSAFHEDRALLWIEGVDLFGSKPTWVPYESVHTNFTLPLPADSGCFVMSSNGLASGNHVLEAVSHALCEVIERDAMTLFRFQSREHQDRLRVDTGTVLDDSCRKLLDLYDRAGVVAGVWDITSDVGIAAFRCVIQDREPNAFRPLGPIEGMGCHPSRETALLRALTEAAQSRLTLIAGSRDDNGRARYAQSQDEALMRRARESLTRRGSRKFGEAASHSSETLEGDVSAVLRGLTGAGITSAVIVDLSRPEFGIPVVRAVVPGLETYHHVQGYSPGSRARRLLEDRAREART
jgi:YcaO-like protein with predicted kinase domain